MGTEKSTLAIEIGRRIAERRKQLGLTQAQAAEKATKSDMLMLTRMSRQPPRISHIWLIRGTLLLGVRFFYWGPSQKIIHRCLIKVRKNL